MIDAYFPVAKHKDTPIAGIGAPGKDGFSPAVSVSAITGGHRVTITDKNGTHSFDVMDGKDGAAGSGGVTIDPTLTELEFLTPDDLGDISEGKTPVKGVDYFTDSDKAEFVQSVLAALPTWNGGSF